MTRIRAIALSILVASALLLSAASAAPKDPRTNQHKTEANPKTESVQQQQPQVPLSVWQATNTALSESIAAQKEQSVAAKKQAQAYKESWRSPSVIVDIALALVGAGYLFFMRLQWKVANKTLALQFRPKLIIRNMTAFDNPIVNASMITVWLMIVNTGGTRAKIETSIITVGLYDNPELPIVRHGVAPHETETKAIEVNTIDPGEHYHVKKEHRLTDLRESVDFISTGKSPSLCIWSYQI